MEGNLGVPSIVIGATQLITRTDGTLVFLLFAGRRAKRSELRPTERSISDYLLRSMSDDSATTNHRKIAGNDHQWATRSH